MQSTDSLHRYFLNNSHKTVHKWIHYFDIYERHLSRFRGKSPTMIEIGVFEGGSLAMWKDYLGEGAQIIGVDINPACKAHEGDGIEIFIGSQDDKDLMKGITEKYGQIDIVLDDGSHQMQHMISSFNILYNKISPYGIYIVEDTHTSYWDNYQGGVKRSGSFMEFVKDRLDDLNAVHTRNVLPVSEFTKSTDAICCYDSVVVFERRPQGARQAPMTGPMR